MTTDDVNRCSTCGRAVTIADTHHDPAKQYHSERLPQADPAWLRWIASIGVPACVFGQAHRDAFDAGYRAALADMKRCAEEEAKGAK